MERTDKRYSAYIAILREELIPAMGCTEPIALAYAAAKAREVLGDLPDRVLVEASGSIIKNVKSVIVPNTNQLKGIPAAATAGIVAGDPERELEVIAEVSEEKRNAMRSFLDSVEITVEHVDFGHVFDLIVTEWKGESSAKVRIADFHTNIVSIEKDGKVLFEKPMEEEQQDEQRTDRSLLDMEHIYDFANTVEIRDVKEILDRQIQYNTAISEEGLLGDYGANIGSVLLRTYGDDIKVRARAKAAAGSDARMNGCELPVVINSGSGNQGITASVPVIVYAREMEKTEEQLLRALVISNLVTIHLKTGIGRLSAYCGVVSASCGAGAGISYLRENNPDAIRHTIVNALAVDSGIVCDGAKASCAAKIASAVDAGLMGMWMYEHGNEFFGGDGIVKHGVEKTIETVGKLASRGMRATDEEIIRLMLEE